MDGQMFNAGVPGEGVGDTYLVETADDRFILRVYRSSHRNLPQIKMEIALLLALQQAGVPASYPVRDRSGEVVQALTAVEGQRYAVLFTRMPRAKPCGR